MAKKFSNGIGKRLTAAALFVTVFLAISPSATAEQPSPEPTPVYYADYNSKTDDDHKKIYLGLYNETEPQSSQANDLYTLRKLLSANGYYAAIGITNNEDINWYSNSLDANTLNALREYCIRNDISEYDSQLGLTYGAWWQLSSGQIINLLAPAAEEQGYSEILWGEKSDNLTQIIDRLYELGYLDNRAHDVYDSGVRDALEDFGKYNGLQDYYREDSGDEVRSINEEMQRVLFSEDANAKPEPKKGGLSDYFMRPVTIAGLTMSMLVLWCIGLGMLVVCILAAIYFFMPSDSKKNGKSKKKNVIHFDIAYNGKIQQTEAEIVKTLKIGRGVGNFPLDLSDTQISRRHCELYYSNEVLMLRDYSSNGTLVNGKPLHNAEVILKSGDAIVIGNHTITITY